MTNNSNKLCMITGANSGIGLATAHELAKQGLHLVLVCRDEEKGKAAQSDIITQSGNGKVDLLIADISSLTSVRALADTFNSKYDRLDILINNAGVMNAKRKTTVDGHEEQFAVHYLGPFLLTHLLLEKLKSSAPARIINISSKLHSKGTINLADLQAEEQYKMWGTYGASKLAVTMFTYRLAEHLKGSGVTVNCLHPGVIGSNIGNTPAWIKWFMKSPETGAKTTVYLATSPDVANTTGQYFVNCKVAKSSDESRDPSKIEKLWKVTSELVGLEALMNS